MRLLRRLFYIVVVPLGPIALGAAGFMLDSVSYSDPNMWPVMAASLLCFALGLVAVLMMWDKSWFRAICVLVLALGVLSSGMNIVRANREMREDRAAQTEEQLLTVTDDGETDI